MSGRPFRVLFVCTGNICRSPMAQTLLAHHLRQRLGDRADVVDVASAGTGALAGNPMEPFTIDALAGVGITPGEFVARDISAEMLRDADLILTATRQHRSVVVTEAPDVVRRAFTIKEFARLAVSADADSVVSLDGLVEGVARQRGFNPPAAAEEDDITDPYGQRAKRYVQTLNDLQPTIDVIADVLVGAAREEHGEDGLPDDLEVERQ